MDDDDDFGEADFTPFDWVEKQAEKHLHLLRWNLRISPQKIIFRKLGQIEAEFSQGKAERKQSKNGAETIDITGKRRKRSIF